MDRPGRGGRDAAGPEYRGPVAGCCTQTYGVPPAQADRGRAARSRPTSAAPAIDRQPPGAHRRAPRRSTATVVAASRHGPRRMPPRPWWARMSDRDAARRPDRRPDAERRPGSPRTSRKVDKEISPSSARSWRTRTSLPSAPEDVVAEQRSRLADEQARRQRLVDALATLSAGGGTPGSAGPERGHDRRAVAQPGPRCSWSISRTGCCRRCPRDALAGVLRNSGPPDRRPRDRLGLPIVVSQQYPARPGRLRAKAGRGRAGPKVGDPGRVHRFDKLEFSAVAAPAFAQLAPGLGRDQWIVCGMETHVCVYQTARDLVARGLGDPVVPTRRAAAPRMNYGARPRA